MVTRDSQTKSGEKLTDKVFSRFFLTSLLALLVALGALASTTYAWYTNSISGSSTLTAAFYDISVSLEGAGTAVTAQEDGSYHLTAGESYTVTLKRSSHATAEKGYSEIVLSAVSHFTEQINDGQITFTIAPTTDTDVFFIPQLGTCTAEEKIANGDILH